jgi:hypothetical protein
MFVLFRLKKKTNKKTLTVELFFFIAKKCCILVLMHSNITDIKCRKRKFGFEF